MKQSTSKKIFVVIPVFNESKHVSSVTSLVKKYCSNIVFVDDGSTDGTVGLIKKEKGVNLVELKQNKGKGYAMRVGAEFAWGKGADAIIFMDGDNQHSANNLIKFQKLLQKEDLVIGVRLSKKRMPIYRRIGNKIFSLTMGFLFGLKEVDYICGFRGMTKRVYDQIKWQSDKYGVEVEMLVHVAQKKIHYKTVVVDTVYIDSYKGFSIVDGLGVLFTLPVWKIKYLFLSSKELRRSLDGPISFLLTGFIISLMVCPILLLLSFITNIDNSKYWIFSLTFFFISIFFFRRILLSLLTRISAKFFLIFLPFLIIVLLRFPLVYPMYDDMAYHLSASSYIFNLSSMQNFMPLSSFTYFPHIIEYLYAFAFSIVGYRLTYLVFGFIYYIWFISLATRISYLQKGASKYALIFFLLFTAMSPTLLSTAVTFMTDYPFLLLMLEGYYQFFKNDRFSLGLFLMLFAVVLKQSTGIFCLPLIIYGISVYRKKIKLWPVLIWLFFGLVYMCLLYRVSGNPTPGFLNRIFKSPFYQLNASLDDRWGPRTILETILWPIIGQFTARFIETRPIIYAKIIFLPTLLIGFFGGILLLKRKKFLASSILISYYSWIILMGYGRYLLGVASISGLLVLSEYSTIFDKLRIKKGMRYMLLFFLIAISLSSFKTDYAWRMFPSFVTKQATSEFLRSYSWGLSQIGKDTPNKISSELQHKIRTSNVVVPYYRGNATFYASMLAHASTSVIYGYDIGFAKVLSLMNINDKSIITLLITDNLLEDVSKLNCSKKLKLVEISSVKQSFERVFWTNCSAKELKSLNNL